jgi:hypothetical protein
MRRFFTWKCLALLAVALMMLLAAAPLGYLLADRWQSRVRLDTLTRRLDAEDPGWRLDDIVRSTNAKLPPDDRNPFVLATAANDLLPADTNKRFEDFPDRSKSEPNVLLDAAVKAKLLAAVRGFEPATDLARDLADLPDAGGNVLVIPANPLTRLMDREQGLRNTAGLLWADAVLLAEDGKPDEAVRSTRAALGAARAVGDDPTLVGQLIRIALGSSGTRAAESVINLGEPDAGLAELQAGFFKEAAAPKLLVGLRGERGQALQVSETVLGPRLFGQTDLACLLDVLTRYIEAAKLPPQQQAAAFAGIPTPAAGDPRYSLTRLMLPGVEKVSASARRGQGELSAVAVGIACERYRRRFGQWPANLRDIPKDILPAVPTDPCDGLPIKYKRFADRVVVYSVGPDGIDHSGDMSESTPQDQRDYGIRLYDVSHRRQPAPPAADPMPLPGDAP